MKLFKFSISLKMMRALHVGAMIILLGFAALNYYIGGFLLGGMIDTFLAGWNAAAAVYLNWLISSRDSFNEMHAAFDAMVDMNQQLLANKVRFIMEMREEEAPIQPRLH